MHDKWHIYYNFYLKIVCIIRFLLFAHENDLIQVPILVSDVTMRQKGHFHNQHMLFVLVPDFQKQQAAVVF